jgi:hypothetical protein
VSAEPLSLRSLKVGDEVVVTDTSDRVFRRRVARIGRNYLYTGERCNGFDLDTGRQNDNYGNNYAYTPAAHDRQLRADVARRALATVCRRPEAQLVAIYDVLKEKGLL